MRYNPDDIFKVRFKNSNQFREAAIRFEDNGCYTFAPRGTSEYREYWDRERDRCLYGYNIGDNYISGYNYFYLNYSRIVRVTEKTVNGRLFVDREETFPNFWDGDWQYYMAIDIAEELGKHLAVVKTRGRGYSYKAASMLNRNFFLIPQSKGYAIASNQDFLIKDGLLTKTWDMMSFLDEHTAWSKRKHKVDTMMHKRASFIESVDSKQVEKGYKSEIIGVTMANDPNKARGKRGKLVLYEESGDNNDLLAAWQINRPSVEQGVKTFGLMIAFGTGGSEGAKYEGLKELFYNPKAYNILEFNNIWDAGAAKKCSFFMPEYMNFEGLMDSDGNSDTEAALKVSSEERMKVKEHAKNRHSYDRYIAEHPFCPMEAMLKLRGNIFPSNDLIEHLAFLESDPVAKNYGEIGKLTFHEGGKLQWIRQDGGLYIRDYPVRHDESAEASIMIWEHPDPNPPRGVYVAGCLLPGEKVLTDTGLISVENITKDNKLVNKDGELVEIKELLRYDKTNEDVYTLTMSNTLRTTTFTKEHPIYVSKPMLKCDETIDEDRFDFSFTTVDKVQVNDWVKYPNIYKRKEQCDFDLLWDDYDGRKNNFTNPLYSKDFWWFVGLWLGDGWCESNGYKISVAFNKKEIMYIDKFKRVVNDLFDRSVCCDDKGSAVELSFSNKQLSEFMTKHFGKYAHGKIIPEWVKKLDSEYTKQIVLGYLDSDGCIIKSGKYYITEFVSINLPLLESIQDILFSIGIISGMSRLRDAKRGVIQGRDCDIKECYHLRLSHYDTIDLAKQLDCCDDIKIMRIDFNNLPMLRRRGRDGCFFNKTQDYIYIKVRDIQKKQYTGVVYNFECETHTFLCHHITTHNCDPFDHDQSGSGSLGSVFVFKRFQGLDKYFDVPVAEYTARPDAGADAFYENVRRLLLYYNATCLYENNLKGMHTYFKNKRSDYLLADQPTFLKDITSGKTVNRGKGIHMAENIKRTLEGWLRDWLVEEYEDGKFNLQKIMSPALIKELIAYNPDGNFDRVIAFMLCIGMNKEYCNLRIIDSNKQYFGGYFNKPMFKNKIYQSTFIE